MKSVILHVGTPKTGTTALQEFFAESRLELSQKGIRYHRNGDSKSICHWWFAVPFFDAPIEYAPFKRAISSGLNEGELLESSEGSISSIKDEIDNYDTVILSAEQFFFLPKVVLESINQFFKSLGVMIFIKIVVRHPKEISTSEVNQKVKFGMAKISDFEERLPSFKLQKNIEKFVDTFGKKQVSLRGYSNDNENQVYSWLTNYTVSADDFAEIINKKGAGVNVVSNNSLCLDALKVIEKLDQLDCLHDEHSRQEVLKLLSVFSGDGYKPTEDAVHKLMTESKSDLKYLHEVWDINFES